MKLLLIITFFSLSISVSANDSFVTVAGGQITFDSENTNIEIQRENITIELFESNYSVIIDYLFYNNSTTTQILTAFPEYKVREGLFSENIIENFHITQIGGEDIEFDYQESDYALSNYFKITGWYLKNIIFEGNSTTQIQISYDAVYNQNGPFDSVNYLLGTGKTWFGPIKNLNVTVINQNPEKWIYSVIFGSVQNYIYTNDLDGIYNLFIAEHEPELEEQIYINITNSPKYYKPLYSITDSNFIFRDEKLESDWFRFLSAGQLRLLRNSIYAYHGYIFSSFDLQNHFSTEQWYKPNKYFNESLFNENEKYHIQLIYALEQEKIQ